MPITRVTISMPSELAKRVKKAAGDKPVSAWFTELASQRLTEGAYERLWKEHFVDVPMSAAERRAGDALFERTTKPRKRKRAA
ncbi:MAG: hypothetical protein U0234_27330 [Sandaracinus sp.]